MLDRHLWNPGTHSWLDHLFALRSFSLQHQWLLWQKSHIQVTKVSLVELHLKALSVDLPGIPTPCPSAHCLDCPCLQVIPLSDLPEGVTVPIVPLGWLGAAHTCTVGGKCRSVSFLDCISTQHSSLFPLCGTPFISYCVQISFFCVGIPLFPVKLLIFPCLCCCLNIQCEYQESSCPHHCQVLESHRSSPKGQRRAAEGLPGLRAVLPSCWHLLESTTTSTGMVAGHFLMRNHFKLASWLRRLTGAQKINVIVFHTGECSEGWYSEGLLANWFIWESEGSFSIKTVL